MAGNSFACHLVESVHGSNCDRKVRSDHNGHLQHMNSLPRLDGYMDEWIDGKDGSDAWMQWIDESMSVRIGWNHGLMKRLA